MIDRKLYRVPDYVECIFESEKGIIRVHLSQVRHKNEARKNKKIRLFKAAKKLIPYFVSMILGIAITPRMFTYAQSMRQNNHAVGGEILIIPVFLLLSLFFYLVIPDVLNRWKEVR